MPMGSSLTAPSFLCGILVQITGNSGKGTSGFPKPEFGKDWQDMYAIGINL